MACSGPAVGWSYKHNISTNIFWNAGIWDAQGLCIGPQVWQETGYVYADAVSWNAGDNGAVRKSWSGCLGIVANPALPHQWYEVDLEVYPEVLSDNPADPVLGIISVTRGQQYRFSGSQTVWVPITVYGQADASGVLGLSFSGTNIDVGQTFRYRVRNIVATVSAAPTTPGTGFEPVQRLTIYGDDDVTPLDGWADCFDTVVTGSYHTSSAYPRPYLVWTNEHVSAEVDFLKGSASLGQLNAELVDKRRTANDQGTGYFTYAMRESRVLGRRVKHEQLSADSVWRTLSNGLIHNVTQKKDLSSFQLTIRDLRQRERKAPLFTRGQNATVFPRGVVGGYGFWQGFYADIAATGRPALIPDNLYWTPAVYTSEGTNIGRFEVGDAANPLASRDLTEDQIEAGRAVPTYNVAGQYNKMRYHNVSLWWRYPGETDADWVKLYDMESGEPTTVPIFFGGGASRTIPPANIFGSVGFWGLGPSTAVKQRLWSTAVVPAGHDTVPTNGADVEMTLVSNMPPSEAWPIYVAGITLGALAKRIYDGVYSSNGTQLTRYDVAAMAAYALATPLINFRITAVADDAKSWVEDNIYRADGTAPLLNEDGLVIPIRYELPNAATPLFALDASNIVGVDATWNHSADGVVNAVTFKHKTEYLEARPNGAPYTRNAPALDFLRSYPVSRIFPAIASNLVFGEKRQTLEPVTITNANFDPDGTGGSAPMFDVGGALARAAERRMIGRFAFGAPRIGVTILRGAPGMEGIRAGDWGTIDASWLPNLATGVRGGAMLVQCVATRGSTAVERELTLSYAGGMQGVLAAPTGTTPPVANSDGSVTADVLTVPTGAEVRVEYASSVLQPAETSGLWTYMGFRTTPGTVTSQPFPSQSTIWVRMRSQNTLRISSAWVSLGSVVTPVRPELLAFHLNLDADGVPTLDWQPTADALGARIEWGVWNEGAAATYPNTFDVDATLRGVAIPTVVGQQRIIGVKATAYTGWATPAVSGTAGPTRTAHIQRTAIGDVYIAPVATHVVAEDATSATVTVSVSDPQTRVTAIQFNTKAGAAAETGWITDSAAPYEASVAKVVGLTSWIKYRYAYINAQGVAATSQEVQTTFGAASAAETTVSFIFQQSEANDSMETPLYFVGDITQVEVTAPDGAGNIEFDILMATPAAYPTFTSIIGGGTNKPALSASQRFVITNFTGWTTLAIAHGNHLKAQIKTSPTPSTARVTLGLKII